MTDFKNTWQPTTTLALLHLRAKLLKNIRHFFSERHVLEVETPLLSHATVTDPHLHSFQTHYYFDNAHYQQTLYLQTSPEFAMKRLLAAGSGPIYQISKAFRNHGESGCYHNPEFTLLEWYRPDYDHHQLMDEVDALLKQLLSCESAERFSYAEIFQYYLNCNPHELTLKNLKELTLRFHLTIEHLNLNTIPDYLNFLMAHVIEPQLPKQLVFIYDYPVTLAGLAKIRSDTLPVAERFEVYWKGIELANGFHELNDADEQRLRFMNDLSVRDNYHYTKVPIDEYFLAALTHGLPDCAGVALGIDRLLLLLTQMKKISDVISFPIQRA
ncbi:elongation factor P--(R)-beta-lysine ligase [Rickettsiella grylli]|uniref:Lysyl-tRNA synthetase (Lysine--tRNA ligase)(LysRS) (GX) n=1 Tax=Rickettsiella grylli TaxID=59196 RepID=A8PM06_9COXI|nr:elongation factor P--(R)-beta-lysine ligase [Rickettsiella grylli]EDP46578.1 putative lysyl-tRNA synthetase (Lysine--tRNA ligase)(LysRS) (GX) [Rickettsiella grylli]